MPGTFQKGLLEKLQTGTVLCKNYEITRTFITQDQDIQKGRFWDLRIVASPSAKIYGVEGSDGVVTGRRDIIGQAQKIDIF